MESRLRWGVKVLSYDGHDLGKLTRVVLHPKSGDITHIVVEKGVFNRVAKLVPISTVFFAATDEIRLKIEAEELNTLQNYEEAYFVTGDSTEGGLTPLYWLRPVGDYSELYPLPPVSTTSNISEDSKALEPGCSLLTAEGKEIGRIISVIMDDTGHMTHLAVEIRGASGKARKLVPVDWICEIGESSVRISASKIMVERLPEQSG